VGPLHQLKAHPGIFAGTQDGLGKDRPEAVIGMEVTKGIYLFGGTEEFPGTFYSIDPAAIPFTAGHATAPSGNYSPGLFRGRPKIFRLEFNVPAYSGRGIYFL
jgi:hypothetical protein